MCHMLERAAVWLVLHKRKLNSSSFTFKFQISIISPVIIQHRILTSEHALPGTFLELLAVARQLAPSLRRRRKQPHHRLLPHQLHQQRLSIHPRYRQRHRFQQPPLWLLSLATGRMCSVRRVITVRYLAMLFVFTTQHASMLVLISFVCAILATTRHRRPMLEQPVTPACLCVVCPV